MKAEGQKQTSKPKIERVQPQEAVQESALAQASAARSLTAGAPINPSEMIGLQRSLGNRKVTKMIQQHQQGSSIQRDIERNQDEALACVAHLGDQVTGLAFRDRRTGLDEEPVTRRGRGDLVYLGGDRRRYSEPDQRERG